MKLIFFLPFLILFNIPSQVSGKQNISDPLNHSENLPTELQNYLYPTPENILYLNDMGLKYISQNDHSSAILYFLHLLKLSEGLTDTMMLARRADAMTHLGIIYFNKREYQKSLENFLSALTLKEILGDSLDISRNLNNIGTVYFEWDEYKQALQYFTRGMEIWERHGPGNGLDVYYNNIGGVKVKQGDYEGGLVLFKKADSLLTSLGRAGFDPKINIGYGYHKTGNYQRSLIHYNDALEIAQSLNRPDYIASAYLYIAEAHQDAGNLQQALGYLERVIDIATEHQLNEELKNSYLMLSNIFLAQADHKKAFDYYSKHVEIKDEIFTEEKYARIQELMIMYETGRKEQEIRYLSSQKAFQQEKLSNQRKWLTALAIALFFIIILATLLFFLMQRQRIAQEALFRKNLEIALKERASDQSALSGNTPEVDDVLKDEPAIETSDRKRYLGSAISPEHRQEIKKALLKIKDKPTQILNADFSLEKMAAMTGSNRQYVSQIINEDFHQSFSDFVNEIRIKEARKILSDERFAHYTIEAVGQMAGFKSKSAFNGSFKKITGITPSFYQNSFRKTALSAKA